MDTRGQGSGWGGGRAPRTRWAARPSYPGFMTRGIDDPENYYYRRVFTDAVRAVEAARSHPLVDAVARSRSLGGSQGGGIALAVGGLVPDLVGGRARTCRSCATSRARRPHGPPPLPRDRQLPQDPPRPHRRRPDDAGLLRRRALRARAAGRPALFSVALMDADLPAVDGLRGLQRLRRTRQADRGLRLQRPRGRRPLPGGDEDELAALVRLTVQAALVDDDAFRAIRPVGMFVGAGSQRRGPVFRRTTEGPCPSTRHMFTATATHASRRCAPRSRRTSATARSWARR